MLWPILLNLIYWGIEKDFKYPTIMMIVKDILEILVSTIASKSAFSMDS